MAYYLVNRNAQSNGDHEVHQNTCAYLPAEFINLGFHYSCSSAVAEAKVHYRQ